MVGIGLGIGLLLIIFVNSTKHESTHSTTPPVAQAPTTAIPTYQPPRPAPVTPRQQPAQEAVIQRSTARESVSVLGQPVVFSNPSGYCTPGKSAREVELMNVARRSLGEGSRLVHAAVRCSELEDYRKGRREMLDHWLQIQLIGPKGNFQRIERPREAFLSGLFNSSPRVNPDELNRRLRASFENSDINLSDMKFEPIGRDGNAIYFSIRMNMSVGETDRTIFGISGITLLNSLPLSINVYEGTGSPQSRGQLQAVLQELLNSLLTEN
jgi:translation elongation factor EF-1beta